MRHTEFWSRMEHALGAAYHRAWAKQFVMADLEGRTAQEALDAGVPPKQVVGRGLAGARPPALGALTPIRLSRYAAEDR